MSAYDFTLIFPSIPLSFGISSDLAAGWSKLVYEQVLMNKTQQKIEVEIQGLTEKEAFVVEQCVKLLFGFKIDFCIQDVWQALKVCDIIGITQSPQIEGVTVQEQLLSFALQHIQQINLIEGLDYAQQLLEVGGEGLLVHRTDIRLLSQQLVDKIREIIILSKFEILTNYAHNQDQSIDSQNINNNNKFLLKDLKREHYIQLRTLFYNFVNQQNTELSANQNIVKILFEELDQQFELDSYINKYFEEVTSKMQAIDISVNKMDKKYEAQLTKLNEFINQEFESLKKENKMLKNQLYFAHRRIEQLQNPMIISQYQMKLFCFSNGVIKYKNSGIIHTENMDSYIINCIVILKDSTIAVGMQGGDILLYNKQLKIITTLKLSSVIQIKNAYHVICMQEQVISSNQGEKIFLISSYSNNMYCVWNEQKSIFHEQLESQVSVIFINPLLGKFILFGCVDGTIRFIYLNESKSNYQADHIKTLKNSNTEVLKLEIIPQNNDLLVSAHTDQLICIWNWESENVMKVLKTESQIHDIQVYLDLKDQKILRVLLQNGYLNEYNAEQQIELMESIYIDNKAFQLARGKCLTYDGKIKKIKNGPLNQCNYHLQHQSTYFHHQDNCVYGLLLINYPYVASSADDKTIVIFNLKSQEKLVLRGHLSYIKAIGLLQENKHIISGSYDTTIKIWEISTGICQNTLNGHTKPVLCLQVLQHTQQMVASGGEDGVMRVWNWKTAICIWKVENKYEIWSLLAIKDHCTILCGNKDGTIKVIGTGQSGEKSQDIKEWKIHKQYVNCIIHLKASIIASGSSDTTIQITDLYSGKILKTLIGHSNIVWSIQMIDDDTIASSSTEGKIKIWNWKESHCLNSQVVGKGSIYTLLKLPFTNKMIGGTAQGEILQWKICKDEQKLV
ncbi:unnamed protein product (macronuclear) [Paramecium tetraurelia]|uniref:Uncharacterized protein n=1 Tax=Paramecium tetraurelia TaxID=5888 RepID=A0DQS8_PARTE|nr:uncharacterized protein GSPATT00002795001 [Paramecium tetraurelia]CAK85395.1 unnamed protein product [Paramecium tetraurelia]|eukprot:XP_001452792.1 hypothetical protein (macronuclear) [Paramecium tetraurelia strain d4-2]